MFIIKKKMGKALIIMIFILALSLTILGCDKGAELTVEAPSSVEVKSASITDDGTLHCKFISSRSGYLIFSLSYEAVLYAKDNPNVISTDEDARVISKATISYTKQVEADKEYSISPQLKIRKGDITWGTLVLEYE